MKKILQKDWVVCIFLYLASLGFLLFYGVQLSMPIVLDETGTMSNAAYLAGYDWSSTNTAMGGFYYKYFQALLYVPLFWMIKDPFLLYRLAMVIHGVILGLVPVAVYQVSRKGLGTSQWNSSFYALSVGTLPSVILYSQYARADLLICAMPWFTLWALIQSGKAVEENSRRKGAVYSILTAFFSMAAYMSHTRGIVLVIATFLVILILRLWKKVRLVKLPIYLGALGVLALGDKLLSSWFKARLWPMGTGHSTVESFDFAALKDMFTLSGLKTLVKLIIGWMYNACVSTYGLILLALVITVMVLVYAIGRRKEVTDGELLIVSFGVLNFLGIMALGILFFFRPVHQMLTGVWVSRSDRIIYGRYIASAFGVLCLVSLYTLTHRKDWIGWKTKAISFGLYGGILFLFAKKVSYILDEADMTSRNFLSLCRYFTMDTPGATTGTFPHASGDLIQAGIFGLFVFFVILAVSLFTRRAMVLASLFIAVNVSTFDICYHNMRLSRNERDLPKTTVVYDILKEFRDLDHQYQKLYVGEGYHVQQLQLSLREFALYDANYCPVEDNLFYLVRKKKPGIQLQDCYKVGEFTSRNTDYVIYVKGEDLKEQLEERGISVTKEQKNK